MKLNETWKIQGYEVGERKPLELAAYDFDDRFWINTAVPADVHSIYLSRNLIEHPYYGHQDQASRFIEHKEWWYRKQFQFQSATYPVDYKHELIFEGLDTYATIYFNGLEIGSCENMHRRYSFDVTKWIKEGKNVIAIRFDPIHLHIKDKQLLDWSSYTKERAWVRKAAMNWGWDWGPRLVTVGIWKDVFLHSKPVTKIESVFVETVSASTECATLRMNTSISQAQSMKPLTLVYTLTDAQQRVIQSSKKELASSYIVEELEVVHPQLWWTHDLGVPYLYTLSIQLLEDEIKVDEWRQQVGIRTIGLLLENEHGHPHFQFILNGQKLFAKGANWIPADHMIATIPELRYVDLINLAVQSNMNMLRVWAGGIYEKDIFYQQCDEKGILVWQDFAFANALFPEFNKVFEQNVKAEIEDNVYRLRNHPSLAIWCGNNEIDWLYDMKSSEGTIKSNFYGEAIYHDWIPSILAKLDPHRPYWPSSPFGGNDANDPDVGDRHNWQVWHGSVYPRQFGEAPLLDYSVEGVSFKHYKSDFTLFSSEFGMHASANRYTLDKYIPEGQFYWNSDEMAYRNKDTNHQKGILLMEGYTGVPLTIEEYMNFSMLTQAEGLKYGIEHYRRNMNRTSGALIWQFNDSWPGTSWSLIDYLLLPKASFYYAKRFFAPLLLSMEHEPQQPMNFYIINDSLTSYSGKVTIKIQAFNGEVVGEYDYTVEAKAGEASYIASLNEEMLPRDLINSLVVTMSSEHMPVVTNYYYLREHKELNFPKTWLSYTIDEANSVVNVKCHSGLARMVKLELEQQAVSFEDNYFDLLRDEERAVKVLSAPLVIDWTKLKVTAINS